MKGRKELFGPSSKASLPEEYALFIKDNKLIFLNLVSHIFSVKKTVDERLMPNHRRRRFFGFAVETWEDDVRNIGIFL
jgi:hypothetical protein